MGLLPGCQGTVSLGEIPYNFSLCQLENSLAFGSGAREEKGDSIGGFPLKKKKKLRTEKIRQRGVKSKPGKGVLENPAWRESGGAKRELPLKGGPHRRWRGIVSRKGIRTKDRSQVAGRGRPGKREASRSGESKGT